MAENTEQLIHTLAGLVSEQQNPNTLDIDSLDSLGVVTAINAEDGRVAEAVKAVLPELARAVDLCLQAFQSGGRLVYIGAGTSGRMGVIDAVECVPTYGVNEQQVVAVMAGGEAAMFRAQEGIEDDPEAGKADVQAIQLTAKDVLVGIAASGRTPYVLGAMAYGREIGAKTVAVSCNPQASIAALADVAILPIVGPEALTGSTRMKSGTAQKLVLNTLSTAVMIRWGKSYYNLMVDLKATNDKLYARGTRMIMEVSGVDQARAESALVAANKEVKTALYMLLAETDAETARQALAQANGFLRQALVDAGKA